MNKKKKLITAIVVILVLALTIVGIMVPHMYMEKLDSSLAVSMHTKKAPLLVAHRGLSGIYPQNTLPAFDAAKEYGYFGYEFDVHTTKDGEWVVIHDDTVDAMTNGEGEVDSFTLKEIRELKIDSGNGIENYPDLPVPTFRESLEIAKGSDIVPVIEIKKCDVEYLPEFQKILAEYNLEKKAVIISFTKEYLEQYRKLDNEIEMFLLSSNPTKEDVDWCVKNGNTGLNFYYFNYIMNTDAISYAKEKGLRLAAWTVDNTAYMDVMVLIGVEIITTNKVLP